MGGLGALVAWLLLGSTATAGNPTFFGLNQTAGGGGSCGGTATYRASSTVTPAAIGTSIVLPVPAGVTNGDLLFAAITWSLNGNVITPPSGWNLILQQEDGFNTSHLATYWRTASSEPANYTWTIATAHSFAAAMVDYCGMPGTPLDLSGGGGTTGGNSVAPTITPSKTARLPRR